MPDRETIAALLYITRWPRQIWAVASLEETKVAYAQADAVLAAFVDPILFKDSAGGLSIITRAKRTYMGNVHDIAADKQ